MVCRMIHDLNNLLSAIVVYSGPLAAKAENYPPLQRYTAEIMESAQRAAELAPQLGASEMITDKKPTLLLVEDEELVRCSVDTVLSMQGYTVLPAASAEDAMSISRSYSGEIHLMVTDLNMPDVSGRELARKIHAARPGMKILYVSGSIDDSLMRELENGREDFFTKPFSPSALAGKVEELLNRSSDQ